MRPLQQLAMIAASVTIASACSDTPVSAPNVTFPLTNVSFNSHVKPVLLNNCAVSGCHDGYSSDPEDPGSTIFALLSHGDVLSSGIVNNTLEPERSRLGMVLRGELAHPNDPLFTVVKSEQRDGIIQWIREGALNN